MSGPEHYREAERLLELAAEAFTDDRSTHTADANLIRRAQAHATLALAAATAYPAVRDYLGDENRRTQVTS